MSKLFIRSDERPDVLAAIKEGEDGVMVLRGRLPKQHAGRYVQAEVFLGDRRYWTAELQMNIDEGEFVAGETRDFFYAGGAVDGGRKKYENCSAHTMRSGLQIARNEEAVKARVVLVY